MSSNNEVKNNVASERISSQSDNKSINEHKLLQTCASRKSNANQEHSFLMDQSYIQQMQDGLLELLDDFKNGKCNGFDNNQSLCKMSEIKNMQENLAQLHFDLENEETENKTVLSEEERTKRSQEKMNKLMKNMETLCSAVQSLHQNQDAEH